MSFDTNTILLGIVALCFVVIAFIITKIYRDRQKGKQVMVAPIDTNNTSGATLNTLMTATHYLNLQPKQIRKTNIDFKVRFKEFYDKLLITYPNDMIEVLYEGLSIVRGEKKDNVNQYTKNTRGLVVKITLNNQSVILEINVSSLIEYNDKGDWSDTGIEVCNMVVLYNRYTLFKYNTILELAKEFAYIAKPKPKRAETVSIKRLVVTKDGDYQTIPHSIECPLDTDTMDRNYRLAPIEHKGKPVTLTASEMEDYAIDCLSNQQSVLIQGPPGTAKTTYAQHILSKIKEMPFVGNIFYLSPAALEEVFSPGFESAAREIFKVETRKDSTDSLLNVIFIDEAHSILRHDSSVLTSILTSLDGTDKLLNHTVFVLCINNMYITDIAPELFREGRLGVIANLLPLNQKEAMDVAKDLESSLPEGKMLDIEKVRTIIAQPNTLQGYPKPYANKGEAVVGDIYNSVKSNTLDKILSNRTKPKGTAKANPKELTDLM